MDTDLDYAFEMKSRSKHLVTVIGLPLPKVIVRDTDVKFSDNIGERPVSSSLNHDGYSGY